MKTNCWLGLITAGLLPLITNGCAHAQTPPPAPPPPVTTAAPAPAEQPAANAAVSPAAAEVVRLAEAGTSDDVILAYIQNSTTAFDLSADQILYLRDVGVSSPVITGMLSRDNVLRTQSPPPAAAPVAVQPPEPAPVAAPLVPEAQPTYVSSAPPEVSYFYDDLSPYGTWVQLNGVGWCWQPRVVVVNHAWRPYCDSGHWVWTDAGWFWQSEYSWGWAPFHYGRWELNERCGWVWLPDRVWGPAWVTWRSEGEHCGWAPLPPHAEFDARVGFRFNGVHVAADFDFGLRPDHFTFIAVRNFHDRDYAHDRLPPTQVTQIYNHTTIINNYVVNNNTVINQGIKPEHVAAVTHTEVRKVAIRDVPAGTSPAAATRGGTHAELAVYRPQLKAPTRPVQMVAQKVDEQHPVIQHAPVAPTLQRPPLASAAGRPTGNYGTANHPAQNNSRPGVERTPQTPYTAPGRNPNRSYQPSTAANPNGYRTPSPNSGRPEQARSAPLTPSKSALQAPSQATGAQPAYGRPSYPLHSAPPATEAYRPASQPQNTGSYNPKGYTPLPGDARAPAPQQNGRPSEYRPPASPNPHAPPVDQGNRGQGGQSRKNDQ